MNLENLEKCISIKKSKLDAKEKIWKKKFLLFK